MLSINLLIIPIIIQSEFILQVMDIGATALCILIHTWKHHLTPPEVANIADKATNTRESCTQSAAAELCLAALAECQTLNPSEIQRALRQCKEKSQVSFIDRSTPTCSCN